MIWYNVNDSGDVMLDDAPGNDNKTVELYPLTLRQRWRQWVKGWRFALYQRARRRAARERIKATEAEHIAQMLAEGKVIHITRDGWFVSFVTTPPSSRHGL